MVDEQDDIIPVPRAMLTRLFLALQRHDKEAPELEHIRRAVSGPTLASFVCPTGSLLTRCKFSLLPCPFCGYAPLVEAVSDRGVRVGAYPSNLDAILARTDIIQWDISCPHNGWCYTSARTWGQSLEQARRIWNKRWQPEEDHCPDCQRHNEDCACGRCPECGVPSEHPCACPVANQIPAWQPPL